MAMRIFVVVAVDAVQVWGLRPVRAAHAYEDGRDDVFAQSE